MQDESFLKSRHNNLEDLERLVKSRKVFDKYAKSSSAPLLKDELYQKVRDVCTKVERRVFSDEEVEALKGYAESVGVDITRPLLFSDLEGKEDVFQSFETAIKYVESIGVVNNRPPPHMFYENKRVWCRWLRRVRVEKNIEELCSDIMRVYNTSSSNFNLFDTSDTTLTEKEKLVIDISDIFNNQLIRDFGYRGFDPSLLMDLPVSRLRSLIVHIYNQPEYIDYKSRVGIVSDISTLLHLDTELQISELEMLRELKYILINSGLDVGMILEKLGQIL